MGTALRRGVLDGDIDSVVLGKLQSTQGGGRIFVHGNRDGGRDWIEKLDRGQGEYGQNTTGDLSTHTHRASDTGHMEWAEVDYKTRGQKGQELSKIVLTGGYTAKSL